MSSECVIIYFRFKATPYRRECMSNHTQLEEINILGATLIWTDKQRPDQTIEGWSTSRLITMLITMMSIVNEEKLWRMGTAAAQVKV